MRRGIAAVSAVVVGAVVLGGCSGTTDEPKTDRSTHPAFPMTVSDCGRKVVLQERPSRVLTIGSGASTSMWAAGAGDRIAVRAAERDVPLGLAKRTLRGIPQVSPRAQPAKRTIVDQKPELVVSDGLTRTTAKELAAAGIPSIVNTGSCAGMGSPGSTARPVVAAATGLDDIIVDVRRYGRIFGTEAAARGKSQDLRQRIAAVKNTSGFSLDSAAAVTVRGDHVTAYGQSSVPHSQIEAMGMTNVFGEMEPQRTKIRADQLVAADPEVIVVMSTGPGPPGRSAQRAERELRALPGAEKLSAVENNRIITLELPFMSASPLAVDGLEKMAALVEAMQ
ncbi:MAG: ABC transporter substrate-binding protein [Streptosporangiales bacterium]|nr:ABC transporter substrate-binding protein [Streptosporangiales bacterium]